LLLLARLLNILLHGSLRSLSLRRSRGSLCRCGWLAGILVTLVADASEKHEDDRNSAAVSPGADFEVDPFRRNSRSVLEFTVPARREGRDGF
jgi:hypothetical protein